MTRRLRAPLARRQTEVHTRANATAEAVDRIILEVWHVLLRRATRQASWPETARAVRLHWQRMLERIQQEVQFHLLSLVGWGYRRTARLLVKHVPERKLRRALANNAERPTSNVQRPTSTLEVQRSTFSVLRESHVFHPARSRQPLAVAGHPVSELPGQPAELPGADEIAGAADPTGAAGGTAVALREDRGEPGFLDLLFPPLNADLIQDVVYGGDWQQGLAALTRLAPSELIASLLASGLAQGKTQQQIAQELLPAVNNVRASAQRTARTAALRVAGAAQMAAYDQLGDLVIGYEVRSAFKFNSREWHKSRSGTIYYLKPQPGQKGMRQCPHPPDEAEDPGERPLGTPRVAANCLCYIAPVLS